MLFLQVFVVAIDLIVFALLELDQRFAAANDGALLQEIAVRTVGRALPLFFINDPKLSPRSMVPGNGTVPHFAPCSAW